MESMFQGASLFNEDISGWDITSVTNMNYMFEGASSFNQPIGLWDVSNVTTMISMFNGSSLFNQSLYNWPIEFTDVSGFDPSSSSIDVSSMLNNTASLQFQILTGSVDQDRIYYAFSILDTDLYSKNFRPIIEWDTILVNDISGLFKDTMFNQDISGWNVSNVTSMKSVFQGAINFNQTLEKWQLSKVTSMNSMFLGAIRFNRPVNNWDVSNIIDASGAFMNAFSFSQDIYNWKMIRCIDFTNMFNGCVRLQASNLTLDVSTNFETNNNFYMQLLID
jgi:surface protein